MNKIDDWLTSDEFAERFKELQARFDQEPAITLGEIALILSVTVEWLEDVAREHGVEPSADPRRWLN